MPAHLGELPPGRVELAFHARRLLLVDLVGSHIGLQHTHVTARRRRFEYASARPARPRSRFGSRRFVRATAESRSRYTQLARQRLMLYVGRVNGLVGRAHIAWTTHARGVEGMFI